ncbi:hypothetical protein WME73_37765 [Sorangium sp. So ce302]|uniref:hypothetical protein n=1 Tax=unclassified Sorangium TaxID=2621164 RepID=UPI003F5E4D29
MRIIASALLILVPTIPLAGCGESRVPEPAAASSSASSAGSGGSGGDGVAGGGAGGAGPGEGGGGAGGTGPGGGAGYGGGAEGGGGAGPGWGAEGGGGAGPGEGGGGAGPGEGGGGAGPGWGADGGGGADGGEGGGGAGPGWGADGGGGADGGEGAGGSLPAGAWYRQIIGPRSLSAAALALDGGANVVLAGSALGGVDFGAGPTPLIGFKDLFVVKYADDGALRWARRFGGKLMTATGVAIDGNDGIAVVGDYSGGPFDAGDFGQEDPEPHDPDVASSGMFVLALDRDGATRWVHRPGDSGSSHGGFVAVGPENAVVVAAESENRLTLVKLAADGTTRFATDAGNLHHAAKIVVPPPIGGVAVDVRGDILVAGTYSDDDITGGTSDGVTGGLVWVAKYSGKDGAHLWLRRVSASQDIGSGSGNLAQALSVDEHGDVLIAGQLAQGAAPGGRPPSHGTAGAFLTKLAGEDGAIRWAKAFPAPANEVGSTSLSFAPDGRLALIASFSAPTDLGGGSLDEPGTYVATYEPGTGAFVARRRLVELGTMDASFGRAASALDAKGDLSIVSNFNNSDAPQTAFGTHKALGLNSILLVRLPL